MFKEFVKFVGRYAIRADPTIKAQAKRYKQEARNHKKEGASGLALLESSDDEENSDSDDSGLANGSKRYRLPKTVFAYEMCDVELNGEALRYARRIQINNVRVNVLSRRDAYKGLFLHNVSVPPVFLSLQGFRTLLFPCASLGIDSPLL